MCNGKMGVRALMPPATPFVGDEGVEPGLEWLFGGGVVEAIARAIGIRVSRRHPAGTQPCFEGSLSTVPVP